MTLLTVEYDDRGRWQVTADGLRLGEIRHELDGLGWESRRAPSVDWLWSHSWGSALEWVIREAQPR